MNLEFINPFDYPDSIEDCLEDGYIIMSKFNMLGTILAAGCSDGRLLFYDFDTHGLAKKFWGHLRPITSINWSSKGNLLLSSSKDWTCILWDLENLKRKHTVYFNGPVLNADLHPTNDSNMLNIVAKFFHDGEWLYICSPKGFLYILKFPSLELVQSVKITNVPIKSLSFSKDLKFVLLNANDRIIRLYKISENHEIELIYKFQDLVNKIQWNCCEFSSNDEYVIGGSGANHHLYIWDKSTSTIVKILEGPKEPIQDVTWHPYLPIIATVSSFGLIYLWSKTFEENWSAFAPDFTELETNVLYEEREDEFDLITKEGKVETNDTLNDEFINIITIDEDDKQNVLRSIPVRPIDLKEVEEADH